MAPHLVNITRAQLPSFLLLLLLTISSCLNLAGGAPTPGDVIKSGEKLSHLHFYFHDKVSRPNATAVPVVGPARSVASPFAFGMITVMDDPLTEGPDPASRPVGRAQGLYAAAALDELGFLQAMNLAFTSGQHKGSALTVLGRNRPLHRVREMPVVGGSGRFRFARGYALARTHTLDFPTGDAVVEYDVFVLHY